MLHNIIVVINRYSTSLANVNREYLNSYEYKDNDSGDKASWMTALYYIDKDNNYITGYNWRDKVLYPQVRNQIYSITNGKCTQLTCLTPSRY